MNIAESNVELYKKVFLIRRAEEAIIKYYGEDEMKTPMHMSMGEEAIAVGVCEALKKEDQVFGYYRSHALYIAKTGDTDKFFAELYGKATGSVRGKGGSMHLASPEHGLLGVSAVVSTTVAPAMGAAFANKYKKNDKIVAVFFGDGALEEGVVWESLNAACLWKLSIIFVCADNGLAVDVLAPERQGFKSIREAVRGYRCLFLESESTDPEDIFDLTQIAMNYIKEAKEPVFMHLKYYRLLQHIGIISDFDTTSSRPKGGFEKSGYRSKEEYEQGLKNDPVKISRAKLLWLGMDEQTIKDIEKEISEQVEQSVVFAKNSPFPEAREVYENIYAPSIAVNEFPIAAPRAENRMITFVDAINEAIHQEMERDENVFVYGIENKVFGSLKGLTEKFGQERCFVTPLSEEAMTGLGLGAAINGTRPIHNHIRVDFFLLGMNQLVNMISAYHYSLCGKIKVPLVIRAVVGRGWGQGFQHSKQLHGLFAQIPGLKVIMPATPFDAKGLLASAIRDDGPVVSIEHRWLYWQEGNVPEYSYTIPIGEPNVLRKGSDITIVATSWMNVEAAKAAEILSKKHGVEVEIIDIRAAAPLNDELIIESVNKTKRCVVSDNDWLHCGLSGEIATRIYEKCFGILKSPITRIGFAQTPCPTARVLENEFYPNAVTIIRAVEKELGLTPTDLGDENFYSHENRFKGPF